MGTKIIDDCNELPTDALNRLCFDSLRGVRRFAARLARGLFHLVSVDKEADRSR